VEWHLKLDCNLQNKTHLICEALKLKALMNINLGLILQNSATAVVKNVFPTSWMEGKTSIQSMSVEK